MDKIGDYKIVCKLGEGGMGEVYKGLDEMLEREVAIKLLRPELSNRPDIVERFRTEAIALARLNHPCIATVYSFAQHENQYYIVLEFVRGETLDQVMRRKGRLPWQEAILYAIQALEGLEHAHRLNIVHRDIKPSNLMVTHGRGVKLMDFGIARILERVRQTKSGYLIGTLEYMSPEQVKGLETDARSDIYSLGALLYEMLTSRLPFEKTTDYDLIKSHVEELPAPPQQWVQELPDALNEIVMRAMQKDPEQRFASAAEFGLALKKLLDQSSVQTPSPETRLDVPVFHHDTPSSSPAAKNEKAKSSAHGLASLWKNYPLAVITSVLLSLGLVMAFWHKEPTPIALIAQQTAPHPLATDNKPTAEPTDNNPANETQNPRQGTSYNAVDTRSQEAIPVEPQPKSIPKLPVSTDAIIKSDAGDKPSAKPSPTKKTKKKSAPKSEEQDGFTRENEVYRNFDERLVRENVRRIRKQFIQDE